MNPTPLEIEIAYRETVGCQLVSVAEMGQRFEALGYRLDRSLDCRSMARYLKSDRTYPCCTTGVAEADTGQSAFHFQSRRDDKFKAMQRLRQDVFAVSRGAILEA